MSGRGRSGAQTAVIASLAAGRTVESAAKTAGISERTLRRWLGRPDFQARLREAERQYLSEAMTSMAAISKTAVLVVAQLMTGAISPSVRLAAAKTILDQSLRYREALELEVRLSALESRLAEATDVDLR